MMVDVRVRVCLPYPCLQICVTVRSLYLCCLYPLILFFSFHPPWDAFIVCDALLRLLPPCVRSDIEVFGY